MTEEKTVKELVQTLAKDHGAPEFPALVCSVDSVDESKRTCTLSPKDDSAKIYGARLQSIESSDAGIVAIPKKGTDVVALFLDKSHAVVVLINEVDKILVKCDNVEYNGGTLGGWLKGPALLTELNKTVARITALEAALAVFSATQATVAATVAPLLAPGFTALGAGVGALPPPGTYPGTLLDNKIKH